MIISSIAGTFRAPLNRWPLTNPMIVVVVVVAVVVVVVAVVVVVVVIVVVVVVVDRTPRADPRAALDFGVTPLQAGGIYAQSTY